MKGHSLLSRPLVPDHRLRCEPDLKLQSNGHRKNGGIMGAENKVKHHFIRADLNFTKRQTQPDISLSRHCSARGDIIIGYLPNEH